MQIALAPVAVIGRWLTKALHRKPPPPIQRGTWAPVDTQRYDAVRVKAEAAAEAVAPVARPVPGSPASLNRAQRRRQGKPEATRPHKPTPSTSGVQRPPKLQARMEAQHAACDFKGALHTARLMLASNFNDFELREYFFGLTLRCLDFPTLYRDWDRALLKVPATPIGEPPWWHGIGKIDRLVLAFPDSSYSAKVEENCYFGYGDVFFYARFIPWLRARCENLVVVLDSRESWGPARSILRRLAPDVQLATHKDQCGRIDGVIAPQMLFRHAVPDVESIAEMTNYLTADPALVAHWRAKLEQLAPTGRRIGICWASRGLYRVMPLGELLPLLDLPETTLFSLQIGDAEAELASWEHAGRVVNLAPMIRNFDDTAAILMALDTTVTVDTAVANLAGALGADVNVLLHRVCDWRWSDRPTSTPWYPSATLWRDAPGGTRAETVRRMARELNLQGPSWPNVRPRRTDAPRRRSHRADC